MLADHVRQEAEEAGALDRLGELALLLGRHRRDARRHDLAALRNIAREQLGVLVVDLRRVRARERTSLPAAEERTTATTAPATAATTGSAATSTETHDQASSVAAAGTG